MSTQNTQQNVTAAMKFSLTEKVLMGIGYYGLVITGAYGIYLQSIIWGLFYTGFLIFGFFVFLGYCVCSYCPYIYPEYSDCLFPPFGALIKKLYKFRSGPISIVDKIGFLIMMIGVVVIPQYWLLKNYTILAIFWIFCLPTYVGLIFYECRRCQHFDCLFNIAKRN
ncbi:MAG: hypothetical protein AMJ42_05610 [Deltaproteobacteria bacterium DG_8]|nr:MAG: hypothetical protein AMJ42_05610 [Deltaproteobacteria bacterium DG_8]